jgi:hypothetical protein
MVFVQVKFEGRGTENCMAFECTMTFSRESGTNGIGSHVAEHLLLQLGVHLVCDGYHVKQ